MHAEPAADDDPGIGLALQGQGDPLGRVRAQALADDRRAAAKGQKAPGAGDPVAISRRRGSVLGGEPARLAALNTPSAIRLP